MLLSCLLRRPEIHPFDPFLDGGGPPGGGQRLKDRELPHQGAEHAVHVLAWGIRDGTGSAAHVCQRAAPHDPKGGDGDSARASSETGQQDRGTACQGDLHVEEGGTVHFAGKQRINFAWTK